jgi:hypothetical protein
MYLRDLIFSELWHGKTCEILLHTKLKQLTLIASDVPQKHLCNTDEKLLFILILKNIFTCF